MAGKKTSTRGGARMVDRDLGYKRIEKLVAMPAPYVQVGVYGEASTEDGDSIAAIASHHEFGSEDGENPPERSFIRSTVDKNEDAYKASLRKLADLALVGAVTPQVALGRFGLIVENDIKQTIRDRIEPELAPSTLARKGEDKDIPLIDTAQLINSIASKVEMP